MGIRDVEGSSQEPPQHRLPPLRVMRECRHGQRRLKPSALETIDLAKRPQVRLMAAQCLAGRPRPEQPLAASLRFDAIGMTPTRAGEVAAVEHLEKAF